MAGMMAEYTQMPHLCNHTRFEAQEPPDPRPPLVVWGYLCLFR